MVAVTVVDFGVGNILSMQRALHHCGGDVSLATTAEAIRDADHLVLPGVGAFGTCIGKLRDSGLIDPILEFARSGRPFLGVCVGMQMMFDASEEYGEHTGLGLLPGRVLRIPSLSATGAQLKVPHIGWNSLSAPEPDSWNKGIFHNVAPARPVYFVHSFQAEPADISHRLADCEYGGWRLSAAVCRDNLFGCQFHPEKSGETGVNILGSFLSL
jgi:glutamine amidotransferase